MNGFFRCHNFLLLVNFIIYRHIFCIWSLIPVIFRYWFFFNFRIKVGPWGDREHFFLFPFGCLGHTRRQADRYPLAAESRCGYPERNLLYRPERYQPDARLHSGATVFLSDLRQLFSTRRLCVLVQDSYCYEDRR